MLNRLLLVDREEPVLCAMGEFLRMEGYEVDCTTRLDEAKALLQERAYGLVLSDLCLSGVDGTQGLALAAFVRASCTNTRTMILTHHATSEIETEALLLGVDGFVRKPQPLADVERHVASLLRSDH